MKNLALTCLLFLSLSANIAAQSETNFKTAPVDLLAGFAEKIPPYSMGPFAEILYFPWAIETGFGGLLKVKEKMKFRLYVGMDFVANPEFDILNYYSKEFIVWLHANLGAVFKIR